MSGAARAGPATRVARRAQAWSLDFALSLLLFLAAAAVAYTMLENTFSDRAYEDVRAQAQDAARLLSGEGYPAHWASGDVVRVGLVSDGVLSLRKASELAQLQSGILRQGLRVTDSVYVYATDEANETVAIFGTCGVGDLAVPETARNGTLAAVAIAPLAHPVADELRDVTIYADIEGYVHAREADVIVLEGNLSGIPEMGAAKAALALDGIARRGVTFIVVGDPGIGALGIVTTPSNASALFIQDDTGSPLGLADSATINLSGPGVSLATLIESTSPEVANREDIALTDMGEVAYARWTYRDAQVWYLADVSGTLQDGSSALDAIAPALDAMVHPPRPECGEVALPADAAQVALHDRTLAHHDEILTLRTVVWRGG